MWSDNIFIILFAILIIVSILHLISFRKSGKRMDHNAELLERWVELLEKESEDNTNDNGIQE